MNEIKFIEMKNGTLIQNLGEWDNFKNKLFSMAKTPRQLEFIGQLVEDLQCEYDERYEELCGDE